MKRRIVLHGPATMTVSLPSRWVKRLGLKKGDEITMEEHGNELHVIAGEVQRSFHKHFDIGNLKRVGKSLITSSYRQGVDEITLTYQDPSYGEVIQNIISRELTGFEIIRQSATSCTLKDLTGHSVDEFDNALRRIWLLLTDFSKEIYSLIEHQAYDASKQINVIDMMINKFSNYCLRGLVKRGTTERKSFMLYTLVKTLEGIGDHYKDLCEYCTTHSKKPDKEFLALLAEVNKHLDDLYAVFYKPDFARLEHLFHTNRSLRTKLSTVTSHRAFYLSSICNDIKAIFSLIVEITI